ncbi:MAG: hypothetical protein KGJ62_04085 [Armatimonadetes bacterium]|nr:hypothetical protein [Armatimonadota bacterium]MDE2205661.1 hypothetical protein [Armatimonadota bacterium]
MHHDHKLATHQRAVRREAYRVLDPRSCSALRKLLSAWWREGGADAYAAELVEHAMADQRHAADSGRPHGKPFMSDESSTEPNEVAIAARNAKAST